MMSQSEDSVNIMSTRAGHYIRFEWWETYLPFTIAPHYIVNSRQGH